MRIICSDGELKVLCSIFDKFEPSEELEHREVVEALHAALTLLRASSILHSTLTIIQIQKNPLPTAEMATLLENLV